MKLRAFEKFGLAALVFLGASEVPAAAEPVTLFCNFTAASVLRRGSTFGPENFEVIPDRLAFHFVIDGTRAYMVGNAGTTKVDMVMMPNDGVLFVETTLTGNKQVTVVDLNGHAVHSRHTMGRRWDQSGKHLISELFPSQYYGTCKQHR